MSASQEQLTLQNMLSQLGFMIGTSKIWLKTYEAIGLKADKLRAAGFDQAFGVFQKAVSHCLANEVYNIFDNDPNYDIVSIHKVLKKVEQGNYSIKNPEKYKEFLSRFNIEISPKDSLPEKAVEELRKRRPNFKTNQTLQLIKMIRDNFVSHKNFPCAIEGQPYNFESKKLEELLEWANNFQLALHNGYFPEDPPTHFSPWAHKHASSVTSLVDFVILHQEKAIYDLLEGRGETLILSET